MSSASSTDVAPSSTTNSVGSAVSSVSSGSLPSSSTSASTVTTDTLSSSGTNPVVPTPPLPSNVPIGLPGDPIYIHGVELILFALLWVTGGLYMALILLAVRLVAPTFISIIAPPVCYIARWLTQVVDYHPPPILVIASVFVIFVLEMISIQFIAHFVMGKEAYIVYKNALLREKASWLEIVICIALFVSSVIIARIGAKYAAVNARKQDEAEAALLEAARANKKTMELLKAEAVRSVVRLAKIAKDE
jgi:hypothetical protein